MSTAKVLQKVAAQLQSGSTYENDGMYLLPIMNPNAASKQAFDPLTPEGIVGTAYNALPLQGPRKVGGEIELELDPVSIVPLLDAAFATKVGLVHTLGATNAKKLSIAVLNDVKCIRCANVYVKTLKISGQSGQILRASVSLIQATAQDRTTVGNFPSIAHDPIDPISFHVGGHFRIGDCGDALASGDDQSVDQFEIEIDNGFDNQYDNTGIGTLMPIFGMGKPSVKGSITISRHSSDAFQDWRDAMTLLQAEAYFYASATSSVKIEIPAFNISSADLDDGELPKVKIDLNMGRNGIGTNYKNANITTTSPVRVTIVNA